MISEFESGLGLIEVLSICFEVSSSSLRQVMDYQFPPLMGPGRRATFGKCQLQQKFSFLIRWTFTLFVAIFCSGERNSNNSIKSSKMDQMHPDFHFQFNMPSFLVGMGILKSHFLSRCLLVRQAELYYSKIVSCPAS